MKTNHTIQKKFFIQSSDSSLCRSIQLLQNVCVNYIIKPNNPPPQFSLRDGSPPRPSGRSKQARCHQTNSRVSSKHTRSVIDFKVRHGVISCLHGRRRASHSEPTSRPAAASCLNTRHRAGRVVADDDQRVRLKHVPSIDIATVLRISSSCQKHIIRTHPGQQEVGVLCARCWSFPKKATATPPKKVLACLLLPLVFYIITRWDR